MGVTKLKHGKPLVRETSATIDGTPLVVSIEDGHVEMWLKGAPKTRWELPWKRAHSIAVGLSLRSARRLT